MKNGAKSGYTGPPRMEDVRVEIEDVPAARQAVGGFTVLSLRHELYQQQGCVYLHFTQPEYGIAGSAGPYRRSLTAVIHYPPGMARDVRTTIMENTLTLLRLRYGVCDEG